MLVIFVDSTTSIVASTKNANLLFMQKEETEVDQEVVEIIL